MSQQLVSLFCLVNSVVILFVCICRLNKMQKGILIGARIHYVALIAGVLAHGFQTIFFEEWPTTGGLILQTAVAISIATGFFRWKNGEHLNSKNANS